MDALVRRGDAFNLLDGQEASVESNMQPVSTGTTIVGVVYRDGVVLGADTRATSDTCVADKNCSKIHYIAPNIYCCGAGTAADTDQVTKLISSKLALMRLNESRQSKVASAMTIAKRHLFNYAGYVSAALVIGGFDIYGPALYSVHPHGSVDSGRYLSMGSGSLAAMSILETKYKDAMSKEECMRLVGEAITAGIFNDLGSGSNVDLVVIAKEGTEIRRGFIKGNEKPRLELNFRFATGYITVVDDVLEDNYFYQQ